MSITEAIQALHEVEPTANEKKPSTSDYHQFEADILSALNIRDEAERLGVKFASGKENVNGWLSCYSIDRDEKNPSAAINVGANGHRGQYTDRGTGDKAISFFEFAAQHGHFADWRDARKHFAEVAGVPFPTVEQDEIDEQALDHRHEVYTEFLDSLTLSQEHRANVEARGLTEQQIDRMKLRTLPKGGRRQRANHIVNKHGREKTLSVPGFVVRHYDDGNEYFTFAGSPGMLIPVRDEKGRIVALRVRRDSTKNGPKYLYVSSAKDGGPSPGAPIYFPQSVEIGDVIGITEGEFKAEIASQNNGIPYIGIPGVTFHRAAVKWVQDHCVEHVRIAFDADATKKGAVAQCLTALYSQLKHVGLTVGIDVWDPIDGKGIDDVLTSGGTIRTLYDDEADAWIDSLPKPAAKSIESDNGVPEEVNDPHRLARLWLKTRTVTFHREEFFEYREPTYVVMTESEVRASLTNLAKAEFDLDAKARVAAGKEDVVALKPSKALITNVLECVKSLTIQPNDRDRPFWVDRKPTGDQFTGLQNGVLNVTQYIAGQSNAIVPCSPNWFSTVALPYSYDPKAECPKWYAFLERNLEADAERINILQEWFGLCLVFDTSFQKFLLLVGEGSNGKSVVCAVLTAVLGEANVSNVPLEVIGGRFQLFATLGKLANIVPEIGEIDKVAEGHLKAFTSGDRMQFERKRQDVVEAMPTARMMLATNNLPRFTDRSNGLWRRMIQMPFMVQIEDHEKVQGMDSPEWWKEQGELPGIFNWSIEGLRRLKRQGRFTESEFCKKAVAEHKLDCNPAGEYLATFYKATTNPEAHILTQDTYNDYRRWCEANGYYPLNGKHFGREIKRQFPNAERRQFNRQWGYSGIWESANV